MVAMRGRRRNRPDVPEEGKQRRGRYGPPTPPLFAELGGLEEGPKRQRQKARVRQTKEIIGGEEWTFTFGKLTKEEAVAKWGSELVEKWFGESKTPGYTKSIMDEAATACKPAADYFGLPVEVVTETLAELRAKAARETTSRSATAPPRPKLTREQVAEAKAWARLDGLQLRFEERLTAIELPAGGFTTKAQAQAADKFAATYRALAEVQAELNLPVTEKPERVGKAEAMASAYRRSHDTTGAAIAVRPRGRPRRALDQARPSART